MRTAASYKAPVPIGKQIEEMVKILVKHQLFLVLFVSVLALVSCSSVKEFTSKQSDLIAIDAANSFKNSKQTHMLNNYAPRTPQPLRDWKEVNDEQTGK